MSQQLSGCLGYLHLILEGLIQVPAPTLALFCTWETSDKMVQILLFPSDPWETEHKAIGFCRHLGVNQWIESINQFLSVCLSLSPTLLK